MRLLWTASLITGLAISSCSVEDTAAELLLTEQLPTEEFAAEILPLAELLIEPTSDSVSLEVCLDHWHKQKQLKDYASFKKAEFLRWCHPASGVHEVADH